MSDCVSREYLLNHRTHIIADGLRIPVIELDTVINAPAVEPERPTGHWKRHGLGYISTICRIETSEANIKAGLMNYCPNCGSKMENNA